MRPTWAEVDLDAVQHNVQQLRRLAQGAELMAVVKANGYGHGAVRVGQAALEAGATWLGVATLEEGVELRQNGIKAPILILGFVPTSQADTVVLYNLTPALFHRELAEALSHWGRTMGRTVPVHIKVDTGMGRVGLQPADLPAFAQAVAALPNIEIEGVFTHLATADEPDSPFAQQQLDRFDAALAALKAAGIVPRIRHASNSAGIMLRPRGHYDLVRAGIALYGLPPDPSIPWPLDLRPALTWKSRVAMVKLVEPDLPISYGCTYRTSRRERIATLPVGYADGYFRLLSGRGEVLIRGRRCPVVGRVCMDQTMVRLPEDLEVPVGEEVVLLGEQEGQSISASDIAGRIGTINYEVVCAISKRVPRRYRKDGQWVK